MKEFFSWEKENRKGLFLKSKKLKHRLKKTREKSLLEVKIVQKIALYLDLKLMYNRENING